MFKLANLENNCLWISKFFEDDSSNFYFRGEEKSMESSKSSAIYYVVKGISYS